MTSPRHQRLYGAYQQMGRGGFGLGRQGAVGREYGQTALSDPGGSIMASRARVNEPDWDRAAKYQPGSAYASKQPMIADPNINPAGMMIYPHATRSRRKRKRLGRLAP